MTCGFGCGSSLFLKMKIEEILKENKLDAEVFLRFQQAQARR